MFFPYFFPCFLFSLTFPLSTHSPTSHFPFTHRLVNEAYKVEDKGNIYGFKNGPRFKTPSDDLIKACEEKRIIKVSIENEIVGVLFWEQISEKVIYFGPFAVSPNHQKKGISKLMLSELDRIANEKNVDQLFIKVVNHRLDLIPWYQSLGYIITGTSQWPVDYQHYLVKPTHFIDMIRPLNGTILNQEPENISFRGSCFCKAVQYYVTDEPRVICYCHCSICRKISGSIVSPWITVLSSQLHITSGQESLTSFSSTPQFYRQFCNTCGTHLFFHPVQQSCCNSNYELDISYGTIEESDQLKYQPTLHIWYNSKSSVEYDHNLPKHEKEDI